MNSTTARAIALVAIILFAGGIWITGDPVDREWVKLISPVVTVVSLLVLAWEHLIWRIPGIQRIPHVPRSIRGTWKGELTSHWEDPLTQKRPDSKAVYLVVRQSASSATITLHTDESSSKSTLARVAKSGDSWHLDYIYLNEPDISVEHRSRMHHGGSSLRLFGYPVGRMSGRYWTDRKSQGELSFDTRSNKFADDYQEAAGLFS